MTKFFLALAVLVVVLVGAVLVVPNFIDWNKYKDEIAAQAESLTGRQMTIGGDVRITLLPAPALVAQEVRLANLKGASAPDMVRLKSLDVRISPRALFAGEIQVESVHLVDPVIELEVLEDGRRNWEFAAMSAAGDEAGASVPDDSDGPIDGDAGSVRLDSFIVENGTLIYRDNAAGTVERVDRLNAHFAAASLIGPFDTAGDLVYRGLPLLYDLSVGKVIQGRTVPVNLTLGTQAGDSRIEANGTLVNLGDAPKFKGNLKASGDDLAAAIRLFGPDDLPGFLSQAFVAESPVQASLAGASLSEVALRLGKTQATGVVNASRGQPISITAELHATRIDLDEWLSMVPAVKNSATESSKPATASAPSASGAGGSAGVPGIPSDLAGSLAMSADILTFRGGVIHRVQANLDLAQGEITVHQLSAQFPGSSEVAVFGFINAPEGRPRFEGEIETTVADLRGVIRWLDLPVPNVASDRLRQMALRGKLTMTPDQVQLSGVNSKLDTSSITGGVTLALTARPSFGLSMVVDRISLDAYLPPPSAAAPDATAAPSAADATPSTAPTATGGPLAALAGFDANVRLRVKSAVYHGVPIREAFFDGTLYDGVLDLRRVSVENLAGATGNVKGSIRDLAGQPAFDNLQVDVGAKSLDRLIKLADIEVPFDPDLFGAVAVSAALDGPMAMPQVYATMRGAGGEGSFVGKWAPTQPDAMIDGKLAARHGDIVKLLKVFNIDYRPRSRLAGFDLSAAVKAGPAAVSLKEIDGKLADVSMAGDIAVGLTGPKPKVTARLTTGDLQINRFLPVEKTAASVPDRRFGGARLVPASWSIGRNIEMAPHRLATAIHQRWSHEPLDLTALSAIDADIDLTSSLLAFDDYRLNDAKLVAKLTDGTLRTEKLTGTLYGGTLDGTATVVTTETPRLDTKLTVKGADLRGLVGSATGKGLDGGRVDLDATVAASGRSVADLVAALGGNGRFAINDVQVRGTSWGPLALLGALGNLGGAEKATEADVTGTFVIEQGVARSQDLKLTSGIGIGNATGNVDLPQWTIDVEGQIQLANTVLTAIIASQVKDLQDAKPVPFSVKGSLDAPDVKVDTASLPGGGVSLPGIGEALKGRVKEKTAVGKALRQLFPDQSGSQSGQPAPLPPPPDAGQSSNAAPLPPPPDTAPPPPPPAETPAKKEAVPEDVLKDVIKQLGR